MKIFRTRRIQNQLISILKYIAKDNISASEKFYKDLDEQIRNLTLYPFKYRQSFYSDDKYLTNRNTN